MPINDINYPSSPFLKKGDYVEIIACARFISSDEIKEAVKLIKLNGYKVVLNSKIFNKHNIFAGSIQQRLDLLQLALDNSHTKAIFFARGGYGTIQLLDFINFKKFQKKPKWLIGFSDLTVLLTHVQIMYNIKSIHAPMLYNFSFCETSVIERLFGLLEGKAQPIEMVSNHLNKVGVAKGKIIGGNLSILYSLIGSESLSIINHEYILFIEDIDEYLYHLERMMYSLDRANILKNLKGLIVGQMTNMHDNKISFGKDKNTIIYDVVKKYNYPICFNFPVGHFSANHPIIVGQKIELLVNKEKSILRYI